MPGTSSDLCVFNTLKALATLNIEQPYDPAIPVRDRPKRIENICSHKTLYVNVYSTVFHKSWEVETDRASTNWRMNELEASCNQYNGILSGDKKGAKL